jgi:hypothetical protein
MSKIILFITVVSTATLIVHADYFPFEEGYYWEFSFTSNIGGMISSTMDSGTVEWEVIAVAELETFPVQYEISIEQKRHLSRRKVDSYWEPVPAYDSTFSPPRTTVETLVVHGVDGVNGLTMGDDSCWSFIHDPEGDVPGDMVELTDVKVWYGGDSLGAVRVDPLPCRDPNYPGNGQPYLSVFGPYYFSLADDIGPAGFYAASSPLLMDAYYAEQWILLETNVDDNTEVMPDQKNRYHGSTVPQTGAGAAALFINKGQMVFLKAFRLDGKKVGLLRQKSF